MKFKFETGEVIEVFDDGIAKVLRSDERYKEIVDTKKETAPKKENNKKETAQKGVTTDDKV